ncbi:MAG: hypothetical protein RDV48_03725 [Candidatus Eremiobacteraeota bacterium]|nr:hypothetical protein [Candidatus Eremiobacteraeota bacterium]
MKNHTLKEIITTRFTLIVSLPENDARTALAVQKAGADAIKVHLNCHHRASGTHFGTWEQEKSKISELPGLLDIPVGIVPGAEEVASLGEMAELAALGFDFLDIFAHHIPCPFFGLGEFSKVVATDYTFPLDHIPSLEAAGTDIIEASVIHPEGYGKPLSGKDLALYGALVKKASRPVFIPTQRKISPQDIPYLHRAGAGGIAIGAVVTGKERERIAEVTAEFRTAIDRMLLRSNN